MRKIKNLLYKIVLLFFLLISTRDIVFAQFLLGGTLQFAKNATLNTVNIYYRGKTVLSQKHEVTLPKITYEIPCSSEQTRFYLLICPTIPISVLKESPYQSAEEQNTIDYFMVDPSSQYLFYVLDMIPDSTTTQATNTQPSYSWSIVQDTLPINGRIPDNTIIIIYFPSFVKAVKGGNQLDLPTIYIDNSPTNAFETEEECNDALLCLELSAPDLNALHSPVKRKTKEGSKRLLVMETIV
jgi:hypothetical protein